MRRFFAFLLVLCTLIPIFAACKKEPEDDGAFKLFEDGVATVVYDDKIISSTEVKKFVKTLEETTGASVTFKSVYSGEERKIVLGNLDTPTCKAVTAMLRTKDYALKISENDYIIGATTIDALRAAMQDFIDNVLVDFADGVLELTSEQDRSFTGKYNSEPFTIGSTLLGEVQIVIPEDYSVTEYYTAIEMQAHLSALTGYELALKKGKADTAAKGRILIGNALCEKLAEKNSDHAWRISVKGNDLQLSANSYYGYETIVSKLTTEIFNPRNENKVLTETTTDLSGIATTPDAIANRDGDIRIMFNNIHGSCAESEFPRAPVADMLTEVYKAYLPDVLGLQEYHSEAETRGKYVEKLSPLYTKVSVSSTGQNFTPLFYRKDRVTLLKAGYYCFNQLPYGDSTYSEIREGYTYDQLYHQNTTTEGKTKTKNGRADSSKGMTWGIFKDKQTGCVFMAASVHYWWESNERQDQIVRRIQMVYTKDALLKAATDYLKSNGYSATAMPIFIGGDYNAKTGLISGSAGDLAFMDKQTPVTLSASTVNTEFENVNLLAPEGKQNTVSTHHAYAEWNAELGIYQNPKYTTADYKNSLDYIFTNKSASAMITVNRSAMSGDKYSYLASDHCSVLVDFTFTASAPKKS